MAPFKIKIKVVAGRNLIPSDSNGFSDPYVVFNVGDNKFKTQVVKRTLNPYWNQEFITEVDDATKSIEFLVFDWDRFTSDDRMGKVTVEIDSLKESTDKWFVIQPIKSKDAVSGGLRLSLSKVNSSTSVIRSKPAKQQLDQPAQVQENSDSAMIEKLQYELQESKRRERSLEKEIVDYQRKLNQATLPECVADKEQQYEAEKKKLSSLVEELQEENELLKLENQSLRAKLESHSKGGKEQRGKETTSTKTSTEKETKNEKNVESTAETSRSEATQTQPTTTKEQLLASKEQLKTSKESSKASPRVYSDFTEDQLQLVKMAFQTYDLDGSQTIDKAELYLVMMELRNTSLVQMNDSLFKRFVDLNWEALDKNGDGEIDLDELLHFLSQQKSVLTKPFFDKVLGRDT